MNGEMVADEQVQSCDSMYMHIHTHRTDVRGRKQDCTVSRAWPRHRMLRDAYAVAFSAEREYCT